MRFLMILLLSLSLVAGEGEVRLTILQVNDVYELMPLKSIDGTQGGLARVATVERALRRENPNTVTVIAGDLISPSALGLAPIGRTAEGKKITMAGAQMIAVMNKVGLDYMTLGNHEFDIKEDQLLARIKESQFHWISTNIKRTSGKNIEGVVPTMIQTFKEGNQSVKVGLFGLTLDSNDKDWVSYDMDLVGVAQKATDALRKDGAEIVIALTHLAIEEDKLLADEVKGIDLIIGGHEHENIQMWRGPYMTPIFKADANARSVYIHRLIWDGEDLQLDSDLQIIDDSIEADPETEAEVKTWVDKGFAAFRAEGMEPTEEVALTTEDLDGREASVRNQSTRLTELITAGMMAALPKADVVIFNGGSIRIDDVIRKGQTITVYDVLRILPFGGDMVMTTMDGEILLKTLNQGLANQGKGGYLHNKGAEQRGKTWFIKGKAIDKNATYQVAVTDFLLTGREQNLGFLKDVKAVESGVPQAEREVRNILIAALRKAYP